MQGLLDCVRSWEGFQACSCQEGSFYQTPDWRGEGWYRSAHGKPLLVILLWSKSSTEHHGDGVCPGSLGPRAPPSSPPTPPGAAAVAQTIQVLLYTYKMEFVLL